jgi:SAM-dependent methyltransferase
MNEAQWIDGVWKSNEYILDKKISFDLLDSFLVNTPKNILDIGCGLAFESEMFQKKYNSNLYLLDGDFTDSKNATRDRKFGSTETMAFYSKIEDLQKQFDERQLKYVFINANDINIPSSLKFDLVYSNVSCGFHYPFDTYLDLLKDHTTENSIMVFDINSRYLTEQIQDSFEIVETKGFPNQKKLIKCKLKFKK